MQIKRLISAPDSSFFLFGPRGTGKSTFIKTIADNRTLYIDFLEPDTFRTYTAFPETLIKVTDALNPARIIIDEVQKVPPILDVVHKLMEEKKIHFILTGSSPCKLKKTGADMLGGRAIYCRMHPFVAEELGGFYTVRR
jgi:predicted AAA+ superfamily ATPase